jgi:hypothetical protein
MKVKDEYKTVNAMLKLLGMETIQMPETGTARKKMQHLIDTYLASLIKKVPLYKKAPDPRLIPDMILLYLYESMDKMR